MEQIFFHAKRLTKKMLNLVSTSKDMTLNIEERAEATAKLARIPRTHTLCIRNDNDALRVTWAKVYNGNYFETISSDTFSKAKGREISKEKMERLLKTPPRKTVTFKNYSDDRKIATHRGFLFNYLPACVADTFPWYIDRAIRYFKIDNSKKIIVEASEYAGYDKARIRVALEVTSKTLK